LVLQLPLATFGSFHEKEAHTHAQHVTAWTAVALVTISILNTVLYIQYSHIQYHVLYTLYAVYSNSISLLYGRSIDEQDPLDSRHGFHNCCDMRITGITAVNLSDMYPILSQ
jgi:hypothetical protein